MSKIVFAGAFGRRLAEPVGSQFRGAHEIVAADDSDLTARLADADVLVTLAFTAEMARAAKRLRLVQVPGAGLDRIDRAALPAGTQLANTYGHEAGIAEYVIGAMLYLARGLGRVDRNLRQGIWESQFAVGVPAPPVWRELAGRTLGIVGYGRIGQAVARRARAFDMAVIATRRNAAAAPDGLATVSGPEGLDDLLRRADFVAVTLALSPETRGLLGTRELNLMQPTAALINVARAEVIDAAALYRALADKTIAIAALDVWYRYPSTPQPTLPADQPFHELDNVLMTPHVSGWTDGMLLARSKFIAENIARLEAGMPLLNRIQ